LLLLLVSDAFMDALPLHSPRNLKMSVGRDPWPPQTQTQMRPPQVDASLPGSGRVDANGSALAYPTTEGTPGFGAQSALLSTSMTSQVAATAASAVTSVPATRRASPAAVSSAARAASTTVSTSEPQRKPILPPRTSMPPAPQQTNYEQRATTPARLPQNVAQLADAAGDALEHALSEMPACSRRTPPSPAQGAASQRVVPKAIPLSCTQGSAWQPTFSKAPSLSWTKGVASSPTPPAPPTFLSAQPWRASTPRGMEPAVSVLTEAAGITAAIETAAATLEEVGCQTTARWSRRSLPTAPASRQPSRSPRPPLLRPSTSPQPLIAHRKVRPPSVTPITAAHPTPEETLTQGATALVAAEASCLGEIDEDRAAGANPVSTTPSRFAPVPGSPMMRGVLALESTRPSVHEAHETSDVVPRWTLDSAKENMWWAPPAIKDNSWVHPRSKDDVLAQLPTNGVTRRAPIAARSVAPPPRLEFGWCTLPGLKVSKPNWVNQDAHLTVPFAGECLLVAVFDGHGEHGHEIANHVRSLFALHAPSIAAEAGSPSAFRWLFALCQASLENRKDISHLSGTTASAAFIDTTTRSVTSAHVGDSTLVLAQGKHIVFSTEDHKFDAKAMQRIVAHGGDVRPSTVGDPVMRVYAPGAGYPGLAMSRSLGDLLSHDLGVSAEPDIKAGILFDESNTIVLASDGVWDTMEQDIAASCVLTGGPEECARSLVIDAHSRWPEGHDADDITAIIVKLFPSERLLGVLGDGG